MNVHALLFERMAQTRSVAEGWESVDRNHGPTMQIIDTVVRGTQVNLLNFEEQVFVKKEIPPNFKFHLSTRWGQLQLNGQFGNGSMELANYGQSTSAGTGYFHPQYQQNNWYAAQTPTGGYQYQAPNEYGWTNPNEMVYGSYAMTAPILQTVPYNYGPTRRMYKISRGRAGFHNNTYAYGHQSTGYSQHGHPEAYAFQNPQETPSSCMTEEPVGAYPDEENSSGGTQDPQASQVVTLKIFESSAQNGKTEAAEEVGETNSVESVTADVFPSDPENATVNELVVTLDQEVQSHDDTAPDMAPSVSDEAEIHVFSGEPSENSVVTSAHNNTKYDSSFPPLSFQVSHAKNILRPTLKMRKFRQAKLSANPVVVTSSRNVPPARNLSHSSKKVTVDADGFQLVKKGAPVRTLPSPLKKKPEKQVKEIKEADKQESYDQTKETKRASTVQPARSTSNAKKMSQIKSKKKTEKKSSAPARNKSPSNGAVVVSTQEKTTVVTGSNMSEMVTPDLTPEVDTTIGNDLLPSDVELIKASPPPPPSIVTESSLTTVVEDNVGAVSVDTCKGSAQVTTENLMDEESQPLESSSENIETSSEKEACHFHFHFEPPEQIGEEDINSNGDNASLPEDDSQPVDKTKKSKNKKKNNKKNNTQNEPKVEQTVADTLAQIRKSPDAEFTKKQYDSVSRAQVRLFKEHFHVQRCPNWEHLPVRDKNEALLKRNLRDKLVKNFLQKQLDRISETNRATGTMYIWKPIYTHLLNEYTSELGPALKVLVDVGEDNVDAVILNFITYGRIQ